MAAAGRDIDLCDESVATGAVVRVKAGAGDREVVGVSAAYNPNRTVRCSSNPAPGIPPGSAQVRGVKQGAGAGLCRIDTRHERILAAGRLLETASARNREIGGLCPARHPHPSL